MDKNDEKLMERYGITSVPTTYYYYKKYRYINLKDAVNYAKLDKNVSRI
jgi:hypothetical protein